MTLIDGKKTASDIESSLAAKAKENALVRGIAPKLAVILVGTDPASKVYVGMKERACSRTGILSVQKQMPASTDMQELLGCIDELNADNTVHGILVQMPLPGHLDPFTVIRRINPSKDVDCFHPENTGLLMSGKPRFEPCTPLGVCRLLEAYNVKTSGKHAVIVGRSMIVGRPLSVMLSQKESGRNCTVTVCHSATKDIGFHTRQADIVVAAIGQPRFLKANMVKEDAVVIDVGINRLEDGSLAGDCDFDALKDKTAMITPVPGGVGPMTIAMLLNNTVKAYDLLTRQ